MKKLKYILLIVVTILFVACPAKAQVFIMDDEFEGTMRQNTEDFGLIVPIEGLDSDNTFPSRTACSCWPPSAGRI